MSAECDEFLARHGDYLDGTLPALHDARLRLHAAGCTACARYDRIVRRGLELVQELPAIEAAPDFEQRLQHRIFHLEDAAVLPPERTTFSTTAVFAVAAVMALLAWSPLLLARGSATSAVGMAAEPTLQAGSGLSPFAMSPGWNVRPLAVPAPTGYAVTLAASLPGPYSPLVVTPPVHRAVRAVSTEPVPVE